MLPRLHRYTPLQHCYAVIVGVGLLISNTPVLTPIPPPLPALYLWPGSSFVSFLFLVSFSFAFIFFSPCCFISVYYYVFTNKSPSALLLLANGANPRVMDNHSHMTPLHHAVLGGHLDLVKELVKSGSDVNALNREGKSAIRMAAEKGFYR